MLRFLCFRSPFSSLSIEAYRVLIVRAGAPLTPIAREALDWLGPIKTSAVQSWM